MNIDKTYFQFHVNAIFLRRERRFLSGSIQHLKISGVNCMFRFIFNGIAFLTIHHVRTERTIFRRVVTDAKTGEPLVGANV
ncbi:MAG: hypothetical protein R3C26_14665 [Calditrichia bacterium]